jgi:acetyl-CoA carboxylase biotin carboxyl carrier protein
MVEVCADLVANVWKVVATPGQAVEKGDTLMILESMKMEIGVIAPRAGIVERIEVSPDTAVSEGDVLVVLRDAG